MASNQENQWSLRLLGADWVSDHRRRSLDLDVQQINVLLKMGNVKRAEFQAGQRAPPVKCFLSKREDFTEVPQSPHKKFIMVENAYNHSTGKRRQEELTELQASENPCLKRQGG
jgi:hypothetical protein